MKFIILFFLLVLSLNASLVIEKGVQKYDNFDIQYLYDEDSTLDINTLQSKTFTHSINSQFTQGYKYGNAWFKLTFTNNSDNEDFILNFTEPIWFTVDLYSYKDSLWEVSKNGLSVKLNDRNIQNATPAFNIHIPSGESTTYYVKANTIASQIGEFELYTEKEFYNPSRITLLEVYTVYAFIIFGFILLNVYNLIITKESIYAYYIAYISIYIIFISMHSGIYMNFGFAGWNEGLHVLGSLTLLTLLLFSIEFLKLKTTFPKMRKVFHLLALGSLVFALLLSQDVPYSTVMSNVYFSSVLITIVFVAISVLKNGFRGALYYLLALMLYLPSLAMMALNFNTLLPNTDMTRYSFLLGAFVEIFLFTLILTNRYKEANKARVIAQKKLLEEQKNNEAHLLAEIKKQTQHLTLANANLLQQKHELEKTKKQLTIEATTDMLSGLYNRRYFFEASKKSFYTTVRYQQSLSVILLDIDKFKDINDTYGHVFGDKVIHAIANIVKENSRESDVAARYGGEEFILLLPNTKLEQAQQLAQRIRIDIENKNILSNKNEIINITASFGVTEFKHGDDLDIEHTIIRCDQALYMAKEGGRNRVCNL